MAAYLRNGHALNVNDTTLYCFFPANQCKNCFLYQASYLSPQVNAHTVIITGFDSSNFKGFRHVLHDAGNTMMELQALDYGNRIITFSESNIRGSSTVTDLYRQLDSALRTLPIREKMP